MPAPTVVKVLQEEGEINDELDYALMNYLLKNRGTGFTACQPKLVELDDGKKAIQMNIDSTFIGKDNQILGLGIVGKMIIDAANLKVIYCPTLEELNANIEKLKSSGYQAQPRPKGKY